MENIYESYFTWMLCKDTWVISTGRNMLYTYLLVGSERALLVDTAWGAGNLKMIAGELIDKPITPINTHCHVDHVGGNNFWSEVYMSADNEFDLATLKPNPFNPAGNTRHSYKKLLLKDGDIIELGNRKVLIMESRAHAESGLLLFDENTGYLLSGDEIVSDMVLLAQHGGTHIPMKDRIEVHKKSMLRLHGMRSQIRGILPGHNGTPISTDYIEAYLKLDEAILSGNYRDDYPLNNKLIESGPSRDSFRRISGYGVSFICEL